MYIVSIINCCDDDDTFETGERYDITIIGTSSRVYRAAMDDGRPRGWKRVFGKPTRIVRRTKLHNTYRD